VEHQLDLVLGQDPLEQLLVEDRARVLLLDARACGGSSDFRSRVTIGRLASCASRSISPWPISPLAPVIRTTGLRITALVLPLF
jgi:hypothetical protein